MHCFCLPKIKGCGPAGLGLPLPTSLSSGTEWVELLGRVGGARFVLPAAEWRFQSAFSLPFCLIPTSLLGEPLAVQWEPFLLSLPSLLVWFGLMSHQIPGNGSCPPPQQLLHGVASSPVGAVRASSLSETPNCTNPRGKHQDRRRWACFGSLWLWK